MARYGDLKGCLGAILQIIGDPEEITTLKVYAAAAIRDIGDFAARKRLAEIAEAAPKIPNRLCGLYCEAIYPELITAAQLVSLLKKTERVGRHSFDIQYKLKSYFSRGISGADISELLKSLVDLASTEPHIPDPPGLTNL